MAKKAKKGKDSPEVKVHKLEIEKLELKEKLKAEKSENTVLLAILAMVFLLAGWLDLDRFLINPNLRFDTTTTADSHRFSWFLKALYEATARCATSLLQILCSRDRHIKSHPLRASAIVL